MKLAIIGTGISGNVLAHYLCRDHDITVYEENDYVGGHTHTHNICIDDESHRIDTGFIVFNRKTYPHFCQLLSDLGVASREATMSFSMRCEMSGLEYSGTNLNGLFAQRRNLFKPSFYVMLRDIQRFNREAPMLLETNETDQSLGDYLAINQYSRQFIDNYIVPMGSAIWSCPQETMFKFPAHFFIRFFHNHGLLQITNRPQWYVIENGSDTYVQKLIAPFKHTIRLGSKVNRVIRHHSHVEVISADTPAERYDYVFFACHSDQALDCIDRADTLETDILGAFPYQDNSAILHTDISVLPTAKRAWSSWNYLKRRTDQSDVSVTYNMNMLQGIESRNTYCVTLNNPTAIDESKIIRKLNYTHPIFTPAGIQAQGQHSALNGHRRCFYSGAYWRYGFHEDGVYSALKTLEDFRTLVANEQQDLRRAS